MWRGRLTTVSQGVRGWGGRRVRADLSPGTETRIQPPSRDWSLLGMWRGRFTTVGQGEGGELGLAFSKGTEARIQPPSRDLSRRRVECVCGEVELWQGLLTTVGQGVRGWGGRRVRVDFFKGTGSAHSAT